MNPRRRRINRKDRTAKRWLAEFKLIGRMLQIMRQSEIQIGSIYYTLVGPTLRAVRVTSEILVTRSGALGKPRVLTKYQVALVDNGDRLPKLRTAAALRSTP